MQRATIERQRTLRVWKKHLESDGDTDPACRCELQAGRFRKGHRVGGCGRARCLLCHAEKLFKQATIQERPARLTFREWTRAAGGAAPFTSVPDGICPPFCLDVPIVGTVKAVA